eukprot:11186847-Lingulodinium_polyedra.AAC.1
MGRRGPSNREVASTALSVQTMTYDLTKAAIDEYLNSHKEEAANCLVQLRSGMCAPLGNTVTAALKVWLPDSNVQLRS